MFKNVSVVLDNGRVYDVSVSVHPNREPRAVAVYLNGGRIVWEHCSNKQPGPIAKAAINAALATLTRP